MISFCPLQVVIAQSVEVFIVPTLKAMMSKSVPPEQQGTALDWGHGPQTP